MSEKEMFRRKISGAVLREAWKLLRKAKVYRWATVLRLALKMVRGKIRLHYSKAVGVAASGTPRQAILHRLAGYNQDDITLVFVRDYENRFDHNAIRIVASIGSKMEFTLGYLKSQLAASIAPLIDDGKKIISMIERITGKGSKGLYGLNFRYAIM